MIKRRQFLQSAAALSTLSLNGCGWKLADVRAQVNSSEPRNELRIYTWTQYTDEELLKTFTTQTGIKVIADVYESNDVMLAKLQASGGGTYSAIYPSDYMVKKMVELNLLTELKHQRLDGFDNLLPRFQDPIYDPRNRYSMPFSWGTTGFLYNSEKLTNIPGDWDYLWQNQEILSQKITLLNDVREVMGAVLRLLGFSYNTRNEKQIAQAYEKLKILKPAIAAFDTDAWRNQILAGDLLLAMCYSADGIKMNKENPKLKFITPRSGSSLWTDTMVIPKTAPNPEAAYAWMNFMLQPEVAAGMCKRLSFSTPNRAAIELLPQSIKRNPNLFPPESLLEKCERITPLGKVEEIYDRYWTQLTSS
jgi:spermidine/putrescine transport system substrate-binding protein